MHIARTQHETALIAAIAQIEAKADADYARRLRIEADPVVVKLTAIAKALAPEITKPGFAGFDQIAAYRDSADSVRRNRALEMLRRRRSVLASDKRYPDNGMLAHLAQLRRKEKHRRAVERCMTHLAGVDAALAAMVTA